jgi:hypothetical protein
MKKILAVVCIIILLLITGVIAWTTVQFNWFSPADPAVTVDRESLKYFLDSYADSREAFRARALAMKKEYRGATVTSVPVPGENDGDLTVDVLYIPAQKDRKRLLVLSSGVHGVEGFTGSAVQRMFLDEFATKEFLDYTGILVIHAMNPFGFKNVRRVTENNVDLNRNSDTDRALYSTKNTGYPAVYNLINPGSKVDTRSFGNVFFHVQSIIMIARASMKTLRQAILQGQYEFPEGLYFGGKDFEPQITAMAPVIRRAVGDYPLVMNIDLHTGYGARGVLHLFPNPIEDKNIKAMMEKTFSGYRIDWGDSDDFYTVTGDFSGYIGKLMRKGAYLPMAFEYGTMDSQTTLGSIKSLHTTILENQGVQHGYSSPENEQRVKSRFREMYYPSSPAWRMKVMQDTRALLGSSLPKFSAL